MTINVKQQTITCKTATELNQKPKKIKKLPTSSKRQHICQIESHQMSEKEQPREKYTLKAKQQQSIAVEPKFQSQQMTL